MNHLSSSDLEHLLRRHLMDEQTKGFEHTIYTRSANRGGLLRLPSESFGSVVIKFWRIRNFQDLAKSVVRLSNGCREWRMHRLIHQAGVQVPEPLSFFRLTMPDGVRYEVMGIKDLGKTTRGLGHLKKLIAAEDETGVFTFEDNLIAITAKLILLGIVDIDHQLNNFVVDKQGRIFRVDFECARRPWLDAIPPKEYAEMIARLLATHIYAVQPDVQRSVSFAKRLYKGLNIDQKIKDLIQTSVNEKLERQHRKSNMATVVKLPN